MFLLSGILFLLFLIPYNFYKVYSHFDRQIEYLESIVLLLKDGEEVTSNAKISSYEAEMRSRNAHYDARRKMLEDELLGIDKEVVASIRYDVKERASLDAKKIVDDDVKDYAEGVYNIPHSKVDGIEVDEYAN